MHAMYYSGDLSNATLGASDTEFSTIDYGLGGVALFLVGFFVNILFFYCVFLHVDRTDRYTRNNPWKMAPSLLECTCHATSAPDLAPQNIFRNLWQYLSFSGRKIRTKCSVCHEIQFKIAEAQWEDIDDTGNLEDEHRLSNLPPLSSQNNRKRLEMIRQLKTGDLEPLYGREHLQYLNELEQDTIWAQKNHARIHSLVYDSRKMRAHLRNVHRENKSLRVQNDFLTEQAKTSKAKEQEYHVCDGAFTLFRKGCRARDREILKLRLELRTAHEQRLKHKSFLDSSLRIAIRRCIKAQGERDQFKNTCDRVKDELQSAHEECQQLYVSVEQRDADLEYLFRKQEQVLTYARDIQRNVWSQTGGPSKEEIFTPTVTYLPCPGDLEAHKNYDLFNSAASAEIELLKNKNSELNARLKEKQECDLKLQSADASPQREHEYCEWKYERLRAELKESEAKPYFVLKNESEAFSSECRRAKAKIAKLEASLARQKDLTARNQKIAFKLRAWTYGATRDSENQSEAQPDPNTTKTKGEFARNIKAFLIHYALFRRHTRPLVSSMSEEHARMEMDSRQQEAFIKSRIDTVEAENDMLREDQQRARLYHEVEEERTLQHERTIDAFKLETARLRRQLRNAWNRIENMGDVSASRGMISEGSSTPDWWNITNWSTPAALPSLIQSLEDGAIKPHFIEMRDTEQGPSTVCDSRRNPPVSRTLAPCTDFEKYKKMKVHFIEPEEKRSWTLEEEEPKNQETEEQEFNVNNEQRGADNDPTPISPFSLSSPSDEGEEEPEYLTLSEIEAESPKDADPFIFLEEHDAEDSAAEAEDDHQPELLYLRPNSPASGYEAEDEGYDRLGDEMEGLD